MSRIERELDKLVHIKFLKRRKTPSKVGYPPYSSDSSFSLAVLRELVRRLPVEDIHIEHFAGFGWKVSTCYNKKSGGWSGWVQGRTFEEAVCLSALKFVGVKV